MIYRKIVCKETSKIMKNKELDNLRSKINNIDDEILSLLSNRSKIVLEIGKHKKDNSVVDLDREQKNSRQIKLYIYRILSERYYC